MSVSLTGSDRISLMKKCLLLLPSKHDFEYGESAKIELRRLLNFAASDDGTYLKFLLFPYKDVIENRIEKSLPETWPHVLVPERYPVIDNPSIYLQRAKNNDLCHPNRTCGVKFIKGEPIYKCSTCGIDDTSGICVHCFDESHHEGHDYAMVICHRENGGICDCGNTEAWSDAFNCVLKDATEVDESTIPVELKDSLLRTMETAIDYVVDVMSNAYTRLNPINGTEDVLKDAFNSALDENIYSGTDWPAPNYYLILYNDPSKQYREAIDRIIMATEKLPEFAQMITEEVNLNGRAKVLRSSNLEYLIEKKKILEGTGLLCTIRNAREVFREDMCLEILEWLAELSVGEIYGNYNIARDLLTCAFCRSWSTGIKFLSKEDSSYPGALQKNNIPNIKRQSKPDVEDPDDRRLISWKTIPTLWDINEHLSNECHYNLNFAYWDEHEGTFHGSRFQHLLYLDMRFWKSIRQTLHNTFNQVLPSNRRYKSVVCAQYVDVYPMILELFFRYDKEAEHNCMASLTAQIFSSTSNATMIVRHGDLTKFLAIGYGFITQDRAVRPCDISYLPVTKFHGVKNKKLSQLFYDVCCILSKSEEIDLITSNNFFNQLCDLLLLFQGRPTIKREALEHVEYESHDFSFYFTVFTILSSLCDLAAKNLKKLPKPRSDELIKLITQRLFHGCHIYELGAGGSLKKPLNDIQPFIMRKADTIDGETRTNLFRVQENYVSLLHPLHSFLSWALQYADVDKFTFYPNLNNPLEQFNFDMFDLQEIVLEYPLRVMVLLSEIKVGMWVRNGQGMKTQYTIYTGSVLREASLRRDLQLIQLAASLYDSNFVFNSLINRWSMGSWLKENFGCYDEYPEDCLNKMVCEFLLFILHILTETEYLEESENLTYMRIKKSLIHTLCFEPLSFSQICSATPDFLLNEKKFESVLKELTTFSGVDAGRAGYYKLKDQFFDDVDPYYIFYSMNKSEKAEEILKKRMAKQLKVQPEESYIKPIIQKLSFTVYKDLFKFTSMKLFCQFLRSTLKYIDREGSCATDSMLKLTLHIIHVSVEGHELSYASKFAENIWSELVADHNEPFFYESVGSLLYKLLTNEDFKDSHPKIRAIFLSLKSKNNLYDSYLSEQVENYDSSLLLDENLRVQDDSKESEFERKKRLALERRNKIMAKFRKQQTRFTETNSDAVKESQEESAQVIADDLMDIDQPENAWKYPEECCILCQMPAEDDMFGIIGSVSKMFISRNIPFDSKYWTMKSFQTKQMDAENTLNKSNEDKVTKYFKKAHDVNVIGPVFPNESLRRMNTTFASCGHGMHYNCFVEYLESGKSKQKQITRTVPEEFEHGEIICPLCKSLGNVFMPIMWDCNKKKVNEFVQSSWADDLERLAEVKTSDKGLVSNTISELAMDVRPTIISKFRNILFEYTPPIGFVETLRDVFDKICEVSKPLLGDQIGNLVAGTISNLEVASRGCSDDSGLVFNLLSNQSLTALRVLIEFKTTWSSFQSIQESDLAAGNTPIIGLGIIEESIAKVELLYSSQMFESIEEVDFFYFVASCIKLPDISMNSIYRLGYLYQFLQVAASLMANLTDFPFRKFPALHRINFIKTQDPYSHRRLHHLLKILRDNHPLFDNLPDVLFEDQSFGPMMFTLICRCMTPFLRKLAILAIGTNADYSEANMDSYSIDVDSECSRLCQFLNLPNIEEMTRLFTEGSTFEHHKFKEFIHFVNSTDNDLSFKKFEFPGVYELIHLPTRLDDITTRLLHKKKNHQNGANAEDEEELKKFKDPAICLLCGEIMNLQKKSINGREGECTTHLKNECVYEVGIFLLPDQNSLLLSHRGNGSFYSIPFIDKHGEQDSDFKRIGAMELSQKKYEYLSRNVWLMNELPNYITRKLEGVLDTGGWESL